MKQTRDLPTKEDTSKETYKRDLYTTKQTYTRDHTKK